MVSKQAQACIDGMRIANMVEGFRNPEAFASVIEGNRAAQQAGDDTVQVPSFILNDATVQITQTTDGTELVTLLPKDDEATRGVHVIYFHGGGYVFPTVPPHYALCTRLVRELGCPVTLPQYPLLPSATFEDILASGLEAYEAIRQQYPNDKIVLMGDSAGGALSIAISQACVQRGSIQPDFMIPFSPFVDLMGTVVQRETFEVDDPLLDWYGNRAIAQLLVEGTGQEPGSSPSDPFFGPTAGLAPMLVLCGTLELLYPGIRAFVDAVSQSGGDVEFVVSEGLHHAFLLNQGEGIPEVEKEMQRVIHRIREIQESMTA